MIKKYFLMIIDAAKMDSKIRNFLILGLILVVGSIFVKLYLLSIFLLFMVIFLALSNMQTIQKEAKEEIEYLLEEKKELVEIYNDLKKYAEENKLTLEERRELKQIELEIESIDGEINKIKKEMKIKD